MESEKEKLLLLESSLRKSVKGQDEALNVVSESILRSRAGVKDPNKPVGSFLFLGPTGVGKTEVARSLAAQLFSSEKKMIRFDMSEYMEKQSVSKLIGSPPGYVGYEEGGRLTEQVRRNPYSIVLFDEVEKAHPDVFNVLLQVLDDGRLTDSLGKTIDFKNTIIIMTSNIASEYLLTTESEMIDQELVQKELSRHFRPEFLNRIDNIVTFNSLSKEVITEIIKRQLSLLENKLQQEQDYLVKFTDATIKKISEEGYDKQFGARPIKRYIEKNIETMIARAIIKNEMDKNRTYVLDVANDEFVFSASNKLN
ncbi:hypothetical protein Zmor_012071 [Zophobas morio]|uniref:Uncharacterized protein n=1 Tax=Zophobas morio TaxID=2755281 RepID=A0AA38HHL3_9CUCU|nr:hypothetical protein Zmor_012071 [Zophobas morio]